MMNYTMKTLLVAAREFLLSDLDFYCEASQLLMSSLRCNRCTQDLKEAQQQQNFRFLNKKLILNNTGVGSGEGPRGGRAPSPVY